MNQQNETCLDMIWQTFESTSLPVIVFTSQAIHPHDAPKLIPWIIVSTITKPTPSALTTATTSFMCTPCLCKSTYSFLLQSKQLLLILKLTQQLYLQPFNALPL